MAGNVHYVVVEKGKITPEQFSFMHPGWAVVAVHCAERNLATFPVGTQMLCTITLHKECWTTDYKLVRDFNLMDKIRAYGLKNALLGRIR